MRFLPAFLLLIQEVCMTETFRNFIDGRWTVILNPADAATRFYRLQRVQ